MDRPSEAWVADVAYVPAAEGWLYLIGTLDLGKLTHDPSLLHASFMIRQTQPSQSREKTG